MENNMTERLDEVKKYVELYKESMDRHDSDTSIMYGLRAVNMLTVIEDTATGEEAKEVESLANEMESASTLEKLLYLLDIII